MALGIVCGTELTAKMRAIRDYWNDLVAQSSWDAALGGSGSTRTASWAVSFPFFGGYNGTCSNIGCDESPDFSTSYNPVDNVYYSTDGSCIYHMRPMFIFGPCVYGTYYNMMQAYQGSRILVIKGIYHLARRVAEPYREAVVMMKPFIMESPAGCSVYEPDLGVFKNYAITCEDVNGKATYELGAEIPSYSLDNSGVTCKTYVSVTQL